MERTQDAQHTRVLRRPRSVRRLTSRRERKKQETRQRLLECAWQLFQEKGYDDTTVEDITEAADVAKGTFFNYFEAKQAILDEIALWRIDLLGDHVLAADDVPQSTVARIKRLVNAMADEFSPERDLARQLFMARISAPIKHKSAHRLGSLMHELVRQGQDGGEIRQDIDAGLVARLLMTGVFHSFAHSHPFKMGAGDGARRDGERPCEGHVQDPFLSQDANAERPKPTDFVDALLDGLGGPEWRKP
jgi:AcrR family transcriptional regulator